MSTGVIVSWVLVAVLTGINIAVFLQLKKASEQMLKMAFPQAKNMGDAMQMMQSQMQRMGMGGALGAKGGSAGGAGGKDAQLKAAMDMLQGLQKKGGSSGARK